MTSKTTTQKKAGDDVLQSGGCVGRYSNNAESRSGSLSRHKVDGHQAADETDQHTDGDSEQNHRKDQGEVASSTEKEEVERDGFKDTGGEGGIFPITFEHYVRKPARTCPTLIFQ